MKGGILMSCGIYKIENLKNGKCYIGCSKNIEHRWIAHKSESILDYNPQYNYPIHRAFRKYGLDNFSFEILEEVDEQVLFEREKLWIQKYQSFEKGYNATCGGDCGPINFGEDNPNAKLTEADIIHIRQSILEGKMRSEIYPQYADKIGERGFTHIWLGTSWSNILPEAIEYIKSDEYKRKIKQHARQSQITEDKRNMWNEIKEKKERG